MSKFKDFDRMILQTMREFGGSGVVRIFSEPVEVDGEVTHTSKDYPVTMVIMDYPQVGAGIKSNFGTLIEEGDKQCFIQPREKSNPNYSKLDLKQNRDMVVVDGVEWKIVNFKDTNPAMNDSILLELHLRK